MFEQEQSFMPRQQSALDIEIKKLNTPDTIIQPDHPRFHEFERIRNSAINTLYRMKADLTDSLPQADERFLAAGEKLRELYEEGMKIRSQMATDQIRKQMGVGPTEDYESVIEDRVAKATSDIGMYGEDINELLTQIAVGLGKNGADVRDGDTDGNYFYIEGGKAAGMVDFGKVRKAEGYVEKLLQMNASLSPKTIALAKDLKIGIQTIREIDPVRSNADIAWSTLKDAKGGLSSASFRALGLVTGGVFTALGLINNARQMFKGEAPTINLATAGWASILLYSINPHMFDPSSDRSLAAIISKRPEEQKAVAAGIRGKKGVEAYEELQEKAADDAIALNKLRAQDKVSISEIGALANENGALIEIMSSMKTDEQRAQALQAFGSKHDEKEQYINKILIGELT